MDNANASTKLPYACRIKSVKDFAEDIHDSAGTKHNNVAVIGCTWSNDDLDCKQAEAELFEMLQRHYNFHTESYTIDARAISPEQDARNAFLDFRRKHQSKDSLLIFTYCGRSERDANGLDLFGTATPQSPRARWSHVLPTTSVARGRALLAFDSCYVDPAGPHHPEGLQLNTASGSRSDSPHFTRHWAVYGGATPPSSKHGFTATLEDAVANLSGSTRTVGQVYSEICRDVVRCQLSVHGLDSRRNKKRKRSIEADGTGAQELRDSSFRVLVQVHFGGEGLPNPALIEQWKLWLSTNLPTVGDKIEVEAMYKTTSSTVLHVSMPVEVWDGPAD